MGIEAGGMIGWRVARAPATWGRPLKGRAVHLDAEGEVQHVDSQWFSRVRWSQQLESTAFLDAVRELAPARLGGLIAPEDTAHYDDVPGGLLVLDPMPLPPEVTITLQVNWSDDVLGGYWTDGHLWDDSLNNVEALVIRGRHLDAREAAGLAINWLVQQLSRPVTHDLWEGPDGSHLADRWTLADTGRVLAQQGRKAVMKNDATSTTQVRPSR